MKFLSLATLAVMIAFAQAVAFSSFVTLSLTLISLNKPVFGFFGVFRRRSSPKVVEQSSAPQGPIQFQSGFPQRTGLVFNNPFFGGQGLFPGFMNVLGFPGGTFGGNRFQRPPRQSWSPPQNNPSKPQSEQITPQAFVEDSGSQSGFDREVRFDDQPQINTEEAESFFTLLAETDENKCISRLICEMGSDPSRAGELGTTISEIIGSLTDFPSGSKVSEYNQVLQRGRSQGMSACLSQYSTCDEESYALMRNSQTDEDNS